MFDDDGRSDGQVLFLLVCLVPHSGSGEAFVDLFLISLDMLIRAAIQWE